MIDGRPREGKPERDVDGRGESSLLDHREHLIVVHAEHGVVPVDYLGEERRVGGKRRTETPAPLTSETLQGGAENGSFLLTEIPSFAGVGVEPEDGHVRLGDAVETVERLDEDAQRFFESHGGHRLGNVGQGKMRGEKRHAPGAIDEEHDGSRDAEPSGQILRMSAEGATVVVEDAFVHRSRDQGVEPAGFQTRAGGLKEIEDVGRVAPVEASGLDALSERHVKHPPCGAGGAFDARRVVGLKGREGPAEQRGAVFEKTAVGNHHEVMVARLFGQRCDRDVGSDAGRLTGGEDDLRDHDAQGTR
jgi:hypothetical protein